MEPELTLTHGSLFSGIGGFDLAADWAGWTNVFHCEINPVCQRVLKYYWPQSISYANIKETDFSKHRGTINVISGGFPCQPFSLAGKRKGTADSRHLWPEMLRAIRQIQPAWVVGENVFGIVNWDAGLVFQQVQTDLEAEGYEVLPFLLPACAVNAPHRRDRIWFVAYNTNPRVKSMQQRGENGIYEIKNVAHPNSFNGRKQQQQQGSYGTGARNKFNRGNYKYVTNAVNTRLQRDKQQGTFSEGRKSPHDTATKRFEIQSWNKWPTQPPICGRNDGLSSRLDGITFPKWRTESIKAYGNAIVPQVAYQIFKAINEYYSITN